MKDRIKSVAFGDIKLKESFDALQSGNYEDKKLYDYIFRAKEDLKNNPLSGIRVPERLIPKEYLQKWGVKALWKYNLPNAWRLIYTVIGDEIKIVSVILEWMPHKEYERRFHY